MSRSRDIGTIKTVTAIPGHSSDQCLTQISFTYVKPLGNGAFGVVYQARFLNGEDIAIKKVEQDKKYKNRELGIMRKLNHPNIVKLKYYYFLQGEKKETFLYLVLEYFPNSLLQVLKHYCKMKRFVSLLNIKLYAYQLFRSLAYLHSLGICHRDVKPENLLINAETGVLKLCDFGSAKYLAKGQSSVSYICSRYYRAPELLFNSTQYTTSIDTWSAGCVLVELLLGVPIFPYDDQVSQLVGIMKVLGTPSKDEIRHMNQDYAEFDYPHLNPTPWQKIFKIRSAPEEAIDLISRLLVYTPSARITPLQACAHKFFNKLREPGTKLLNNMELPPLFNFSERELKIQPNLNSILIPPHLKDNFRPVNDDPVTRITETSNVTDTLASPDI